MARKATGQVRCSNDVWVARVALRDRERVSLPMPSMRGEAQARDRAAELARVAARMRQAGVALEVMRGALRKCASAATERDLRAVQAVVDELVGGKVQLAGVPHLPTFQAIAQSWTSGELATKFKDDVKTRATAETDESRLRRFVYPSIGGLPIDQIALDDCDAVKHALPERLAPATRKAVCELVQRVFNLAVYPIKALAVSPLPRAGWVPGAGDDKARSFLFPSDDAALMACSAVPLAYRFLYGWVAREGLRVDEAARATISDVKLDAGAFHLDVNKTNDPRMWALSADTLAATRIYLERYRPNAKPGDALFLDDLGKPFCFPKGLPRRTAGGRTVKARKTWKANDAAAIFRRHLRAAGVDQTRPELFERSDTRLQIRVHDQRATFVTVALANGRSETWVTDRTGHKSHSMVMRYRRAARQLHELQLGALAPLDQAIPELRATPATTTTPELAPPLDYPRFAHAPRQPRGIAHVANVVSTQSVPNDSKYLRENGAIGGQLSPIVEARGQSVGNGELADPVEVALADALQRAADAGQWTTVEILSRELTARREARAGVVQLDAKRKRGPR